jgi:hypothetical protein
MACTHPRWRDDDRDGVQSICCAVCGMDSHDAQRALLAEPAWEEPEPEPDGVFVMAAPLWWTPRGVEPDRDVLEAEAMLACPAYGPAGTGQCQSGCWTEPRCQVDEPLEGWETHLVLVVPPMVVRPTPRTRPVDKWTMRKADRPVDLMKALRESVDRAVAKREELPEPIELRTVDGKVSQVEGYRWPCLVCSGRGFLVAPQDTPRTTCPRCDGPAVECPPAVHHRAVQRPRGHHPRAGQGAAW